MMQFYLSSVVVILLLPW